MTAASVGSLAGSQRTSTASTGSGKPSGSAGRPAGTRSGCAGRRSCAARRWPGPGRSRKRTDVRPPRPGHRSSRRPSGSLSPAQPDPQAHRGGSARLPCSMPCCMTTAHAERCRGRGEHDHQAVAQVLDLGAARFGDGLAQHREVLPADLVSCVGREALGQLRGGDDVGEEDGHVLGAHGNAHFPPTAPL